MTNIKFNFVKTSGTRVTGGHRSSNGWVTSWIDYVYYKLTTDTNNAKLSLNACLIIQEYLAIYKNSSETDQDWGVYISDESYEQIIDISQLISELNNIQSNIYFQQDNVELPYSISELLDFSLSEHHEALTSIRTTKLEMDKEIAEIKLKYQNLTIKRLYVHLSKLIQNDQIDFSSTYGGLDYYPLDLISLNQDFPLLVDSVIKYANAKFNYPNAIYTLLTTNAYSYFDIRNCTIPNVDKDTNNALSKFLLHIEDEYGKMVYGVNRFGNSQWFEPKILEGMTNLIMSFLICGDFDSYNKVLEIPIYSRCHYIFSPIFKFALLAFKQWDKLDFSEPRNSYSGETDINFFRLYIFHASHPIFKKELLPFLKKCLNDNIIIAKLASINYQNLNDINEYEMVKNRIKSIIKEIETN